MRPLIQEKDFPVPEEKVHEYLCANYRVEYMLAARLGDQDHVQELKQRAQAYLRQQMYLAFCRETNLNP